MKIYNTLSKKKEDFIPIKLNEVKLYTCGPTVYHYAHIGNLRTYIFEDILEKTLIYLGYDVKRVMNITDVGHMSGDVETGEDKMISAMKREGKSVFEIADFYTNAFKNDCSKLNVKWPNIVEKASDHIDKYIEMISKLLSLGYAYKADGNVYFDISKIDNYYELSGKNKEDLMVAVRDNVNVDNSKKNPYDFGLWFTSSKFENQALKWDSPFGLGYPGWHIECSGISNLYLGDSLDIHCGGVDNIFPHHTNEIAQSEAYLGHKWCNYWMHGEHLNDKSGKMSKSKGEFLTVSLLEEKGYDPIVYRYFCLLSHYRKQLVFSYESLDIAKKSYDKLKNKILNLKEDFEVDFKSAEKFIEKFRINLKEDLNTTNNITLIHDILKSNLNDSTKIYIIKDFEKVLSLNLFLKEEFDSEFISYIKQKIEERNKYKKEKNFELADNIRKELFEKGVLLKDGRNGTSYSKI